MYHIEMEVLQQTMTSLNMYLSVIHDIKKINTLLAGMEMVSLRFNRESSNVSHGLYHSLIIGPPSYSAMGQAYSLCFVQFDPHSSINAFK